MVSTYREEVNEYKNKKRQCIEDAPMPHRKKKKKPHKKADHKHVYVPAIFHDYFTDYRGERKPVINTGSYCEKCGRINEFRYYWSNTERDVAKFKEEHPDYRELILKEDWDLWKDKTIPLNETYQIVPLAETD